MIARLSGRLVEKSAHKVVVDVGGVGYEVFIPVTTYYDLGNEGADVSLHIYTHVKEDILSLYGFLTRKEKRLFALLIQISGIGPRLAITILSGLPADRLAQAVVDGDLVRLRSIPGIGKKTAERIILEIREKIADILPEMETPEVSLAGSVRGDVVSALVNLGYAKNLAERAVSEVARKEGSDQFEVLLRATLRRISG